MISLLLRFGFDGACRSFSPTSHCTPSSTSLPILRVNIAQTSSQIIEATASEGAGGSAGRVPAPIYASFAPPGSLDKICQMAATFSSMSACSQPPTLSKRNQKLMTADFTAPSIPPSPAWATSLHLPILTAPSPLSSGTQPMSFGLIFDEDGQKSERGVAGGNACQEFKNRRSEEFPLAQLHTQDGRTKLEIVCVEIPGSKGIAAARWRGFKVHMIGMREDSQFQWIVHSSVKCPANW
ncbi:uncharacterized protein LACBIDRAFT_295668 [Laccaria bicolor S238N-H82]|uniref:Predicted protein n=1 Tax=Laccaria bicolor (strain S238N-H82 / ATCC MYA-4686) TaxID=486041 RepID=B0DWQ1_LACBS|nr:uncharacterized protein LACBIDRAFT_295668 [Laccaria bicolor S238N-H82]EDR00971.1 predicted protein [Laccaria bicolor S238N-H82]|eukprot:XP_001888366.1 predicted protein [Laccaria bicolor S238N-H82]